MIDPVYVTVDGLAHSDMLQGDFLEVEGVVFVIRANDLIRAICNTRTVAAFVMTRLKNNASKPKAEFLASEEEAIKVIQELDKLIHNNCAITNLKLDYCQTQEKIKLWLEN